MPPRKSKKTPSEIQRRIDRKKEALPAERVNQDQYGYVSGSLQYMRDNRASLSPSQRAQLDDIERARRENYDPIVSVRIPNYVQPNGRQIPAFRNNNPGNIRSTRTGEFIRYDNPAAGAQALEQQLRIDSARGLTVEEFVYKYAPPGENDTEKYIRQLSNSTGVNRNSVIRQVPLAELTNFIAMKESGSRVERQSQSAFQGRGAGAKF